MSCGLCTVGLSNVHAEETHLYNTEKSSCSIWIVRKSQHKPAAWPGGMQEPAPTVQERARTRRRANF
jgi:hypothetical protein